MGSLNYLRIAQILRGKVSEISGPVPSFGAIGALQTAAERFRVAPEENEPEDVIEPKQYPLLAKAFESVREGYELDRVIVDPSLSKRLLRECRSFGVDAPPSAIYKRLQTFRKSARYGIKFKKTTRIHGIDPEPFFYAAELGYVQLSYRRKASIDDIITEPEIGDLFVELCRTMAPTGSAMEFKWAALSLRKMRSFEKDKADHLLSVKTKDIESQLETVGTMDRVVSASIPKTTGIFSLAEVNGHAKYLYVGSGDNLRDSVEPFSAAKPLLAMAGRFWSPSASDITLSIGSMPKRWNGASARDWSLRLIQDYRPLFNMPVEIGEADEKLSVKRS
jgi:hypothetical protein